MLKVFMQPCGYTYTCMSIYHMQIVIARRCWINAAEHCCAALRVGVSILPCSIYIEVRSIHTCTHTMHTHNAHTCTHTMHTHAHTCTHTYTHCTHMHTYTVFRSHTTFSSYIIHELMLSHTCAHTYILAYMALYTIVWRIFLYTTTVRTRTHTHTHTHTYTHMYSVLAHTSYTCGKQYTCLMMVRTLSLTNIVTCTCIQLIAFLFVYQACITRTCTHSGTHTHDIHTQTHKCTYRHTNACTHTSAHTDTQMHIQTH